jgi:hypothetical protein
MKNPNQITITGTQLGAKRPLFPPTPLTLPHTSSLTLRTLITHAVQQEIAAFRQRQEERRLFRVLSSAQIDAGRTAGKIDPAAKEATAEVDAETAVRTALQAFTDGLYFVFLDDQQIEALDEPLTLQPDSSLKFIRLVALTGG